MVAGGERLSGNWTHVAHQPAVTVLFSGDGGGRKHNKVTQRDKPGDGGQMKIWYVHGDQTRKCERQQAAPTNWYTNETPVFS